MIFTFDFIKSWKSFIVNSEFISYPKIKDENLSESVTDLFLKDPWSESYKWEKYFLANPWSHYCFAFDNEYAFVLNLS